MTKIMKKSLLFFLALALLAPFQAGLAYDYYGGSYTYRSTVLGTGIVNKGGGVFQISGEAGNFSTGDNIHMLSRLFDIRNTQSFRVRAELLRSGQYVRDWVSQEYRPNGAWWAETYAWHNFGKLTEGEYSLKVYISHNGAAWHLRDTKHFRIQKTTYYPGGPDYYPPYQSAQYRHGWSKTGTSVRNTYSWYYDIDSPKTVFSTAEDIYILTNLQDIRYVDRFRLKFEVYRADSRRQTHEGVWFYPGGRLWQDNFNAYKIGRMPKGWHEARVYIRINNEDYRLLHTQHFEVRSQYDHSRAEYRHTYTHVGTQLDKTGSYDFHMRDPRTDFSTSDYIKALTRLEAIGRVDKFRVKHVLHEGSRVVRTEEGAWQYPLQNWWQYNFTAADLGRLSAGRYSLKTYVQINDESYRLQNEKEFTISERHGSSSGYHYSYQYQGYSYQYFSYPYGYTGTRYPSGWSDPGGQYAYNY